MDSKEITDIKKSMSALGYDIERIGKKIDKTNDLLLEIKNAISK